MSFGDIVVAAAFGGVFFICVAALFDRFGFRTSEELREASADAERTEIPSQAQTTNEQTSPSQQGEKP